VHIHFLKAMYRKEDAPETMRPEGEKRRGGGVRCSDEEKKQKKKRRTRVKREVGGEEKCSECLRAAQLLRSGWSVRAAAAGIAAAGADRHGA
jgi:hypothetical protein